MSIFLAFLIGLTACSINDPQLPKWNTEWQLSLSGGSVTLNDLLQNSNLKDSLGTNYYTVQDSSEKQTIDPGDLSFKGNDQHFANKLGIFMVKKPQPKVTRGETFSEIFADYNPQVGTLFPKLAPFSLTPDPRTVTFDEFQEMNISQGTFSVKFHNDLILGIGGGMKIIISDLARIADVDSGLIDTIYFNGPIPQGTTLESQQVNLAGKTISNNIQLQYLIPIAGTDSAQTLTQDDINSSFYTEVVMSNIKVISASARVPEQSFTYDNNAPVVVSELAIRRARVQKGKLHFAVYNHMNLTGNFSIILPNFKTQSGANLVSSFRVGARQIKNIELDLQQYILQNNDYPGEILDSIQYQIQAVTDSTLNNVLLSADDSLSVNVVMDTLFFSTVEGYLAPRDIAIPAVTQSDLFDFSKLTGKFTLPDLVMTMNFHSKFDMGIDLAINVIGYHRDTQTGMITDSIDIHVNKTVKGGNNPNPTSLILDRESSAPNIVDLMSIMPTDLKITGHATIGGDGLIAIGDAFWVDYKIESPLTIKLDEPLQYQVEKSAINDSDIDSESRNKIAANLTAMRATLTTFNHFPIGAHLKLFVSRDSSNLYSDVISDSTKKTIIDIGIEPGEQNSNGVVIASTSGEQSINLTSKQIHIFETVPVYYGAQVILPQTTAPARFKNSDALQYEPVLRFKVKVDPNAF